MKVGDLVRISCDLVEEPWEDILGIFLDEWVNDNYRYLKIIDRNRGERVVVVYNNDPEAVQVI